MTPFMRAMSYTGNEYQKMTYDELKEVTQQMARAARRRLKNVKEGHAYLRLQQIADDEGLTKNVKGITLDEQGEIKISVRTKGKNRLTMPEMRTLRKTLYNYLTDETSTKKGLEKHRQEQRKVLDLDDDFWNKEEITLKDILDKAETASDLIRFGQNRLDWDSSQIFAAIIECGGYRKMKNEGFVKKLRKKIEQMLGDRKEELVKDMDSFFYDEEE